MNINRDSGLQIELSNRTALITGSNSPIGIAIAQNLAAAGAQVVLAVHEKTNRAKYLAEELGTSMLTTDLNDPEEIKNLISETLELTGRLDFLINNAANQTSKPLTEIDYKSWDSVANTNLRSAHLMMRAACLPLSQDGGGVIINVASIEAHQPAPNHGHYSASKAGLLMLSRSAALEYGPSNIRVNSVSPGLIDDGELTKRWPDGVERWLNANPLGRLGKPEDVANTVTFLVSPMADWITGSDFVVDGGMLSRPTW